MITEEEQYFSCSAKHSGGSYGNGDYQIRLANTIKPYTSLCNSFDGNATSFTGLSRDKFPNVALYYTILFPYPLYIQELSFSYTSRSVQKGNGLRIHEAPGIGGVNFPKPVNSVKSPMLVDFSEYKFYPVSRVDIYAANISKYSEITLKAKSSKEIWPKSVNDILTRWSRSVFEYHTWTRQRDNATYKTIIDTGLAGNDSKAIVTFKSTPPVDANCIFQYGCSPVRIKQVEIASTVPIWFKEMTLVTFPWNGYAKFKIHGHNTKNGLKKEITAHDVTGTTYYSLYRNMEIFKFLTIQVLTNVSLSTISANADFITNAESKALWGY